MPGTTLLSPQDFKCADSNPIGESLSCDMLATMRCVKQQTYAKTSKVVGAHCYEGRPCVDGLTCSTSDKPRVQGCARARGGGRVGRLSQGKCMAAEGEA